VGRATAAGEFRAEIDPRGPPPCAGRDVLRPRSTGLASKSAAPGRCLHRWTTPATR
jgi:hypothetical protein